MKKLMALTAAAVMTSTAAMADVALSGAASVTFNDNGTAANTTSSAATLTITGSNGGTAAAATLDLIGGGMTAGNFTTSIGPVGVSAAMAGGSAVAVTLSIDVLAGDVSIALDQAGNATVSTTVAGVALSHTIGGTTKGSATLAGMDVAIERTNAGDTTWDVSTTLNGVTLSIDEAGAVTASMGLAGNTVVIANGTAGTTVTVKRDLTSGASLEAKYATTGNALSLTASVAF